MTDAKPILYSCPVCGCTDIEFKSWTHANDERVMSDCGDGLWCPQCQHEHDEIAATTETPRPFDAKRDPTWCDYCDSALVNEDRPQPCNCKEVRDAR